MLGFVSDTGIAGLTLGGGFGYLTRRCGWTRDNVASMDVVTADGTSCARREHENADLFWGLRGGGGNFGVVTSFEYQLHPVGPEILGGAIAWRGRRGGTRARALPARSSPTRRPSSRCVAVLRIAPPAPWLPKDVHGKPIVAIFACYSRPLEEGEKLAGAASRPSARRSATSLQRGPTSQQIAARRDAAEGPALLLEVGVPPRLRAGALRARDRARGQGLASPHSAILLFQIDGADRTGFPADHSAVGNRDAIAVLNIASSWERAEDDARNIAWARDAWQDMRHSRPAAPTSTSSPRTTAPIARAPPTAETTTRLAALKAKWDPDNTFRATKSRRREMLNVEC